MRRPEPQRLNDRTGLLSPEDTRQRQLTCQREKNTRQREGWRATPEVLQEINQFRIGDFC